MGFSDPIEFWNEYFDKKEFFFGEKPDKYLVEQTNRYLTPGNKFLCIADGEGARKLKLT